MLIDSNPNRPLPDANTPNGITPDINQPGETPDDNQLNPEVDIPGADLPSNGSIADLPIVGMPNGGKSSRISNYTHSGYIYTDNTEYSGNNTARNLNSR